MAGKGSAALENQLLWLHEDIYIYIIWIMVNKYLILSPLIKQVTHKADVGKLLAHFPYIDCKFWPPALQLGLKLFLCPE